MMAVPERISTGRAGIVMRAAAGAACGWLVAALADRPGDPAWGVLAAAGVLAVAFAAAPSVAGGAGKGIVACLALASVIGMYLGVPETDHVRGVAVVLAVVALAELRRQFNADTLVVMTIDAALLWTGVHGAVGRPAALVGAMTLLGLLLVGPLVGAGQKGIGPASRARALSLVGLQLVFAVVVARHGAIRPDVGGALVVSAIGLIALVVGGRLVVGARSW